MLVNLDLESMKKVFDKDLNKIANIPESYDINIKSVRSIAKELAKQDEKFKLQ